MKELSEQALSDALRNLPLRSAPATLEFRVLHTLEHHRAHAGWHLGFAHWPIAARTGFLGTCIALVAGSLMDTRWSFLGSAALRRIFSGAMSWTYPAAGIFSSVTEMSVWITHAVPANWLYTLVAIAAGLYAALFGLGIVAYRTLYVSPSHAR